MREEDRLESFADAEELEEVESLRTQEAGMLLRNALEMAIKIVELSADKQDALKNLRELSILKD